jgi:hypothetical protein
MPKKRLVWFTFLLILCLFGGGLYYAISRPSFPFPISTLDSSWQARLHFWFNYKFIASGLERAAQKSNEKMSDWEHVEVWFSEHDRIWWCFVSRKKGSILIAVPEEREPGLLMFRPKPSPPTATEGKGQAGVELLGLKGLPAIARAAGPGNKKE